MGMSLTKSRRRANIWATHPGSPNVASSVTRAADPRRNGSWLHGALRTRVDRIERTRATDVEPVSLLAAEAQVGDGFRNVDLAEQFASWRIAAHAVLVRIAPADRQPDAPLGVGAHPVGDAGLGHFRKHFAVRHLPGAHIEIERTDMRWVVRPIGEPGIDDIELSRRAREQSRSVPRSHRRQL